ncbi:MAG: starch-binding protein [Prevotella sp.]|nr:starch-binding protein [Prevotella sp.]
MAASTTYEFGFQDGDSFYKNDGTMTESNSIGWGFSTGASNNAKITTSVAGSYTFKIYWDNGTPKISVIYPTATQFVVHFKKGTGWASVHAYRFTKQNGFTTEEATWPSSNVLSENANNPGYYDVIFTDKYETIVFNDNGSDTNKSGDVAVNFEYPETWVTDNATIQTIAPEGWVGYTRSVTADNFGTICLPFAATVTGATVFKITGQVMTDGNLSAINLESVDELEAGKAYIFKATDATLTATYSGTYTAASAGYGMMGNLSANAVTVPQGNYVVGTDNKLHKVTGDGVTVGQNKGYITLEEIAVVGARAMNFISFDDEATGINSVNRETINNNEYFNLAGQRIAQPTKGLYIVNGKKVVIR